MNGRAFRSFSDELQKIAAIPGLAFQNVKALSAGSALGSLRNGGVRPPIVPKIGVIAPKV